MNPQWRIIYYETSDGKCPVQEFIDTRKERDQAKMLSWIALLEKRGPHLPRPYADFLEDGIHELRVKLSGDQVRVLYFFCFRDFIILTRVFIKHSDRVPQSQIRQAQKMRDDFLKRFDEQILREETNENL